MPWHGWHTHRGTLHIGKVGRRKRLALYSRQAGRAVPLAYFRSAGAAAFALREIDRLIYQVDITPTQMPSPVSVNADDFTDAELEEFSRYVGLTD